MKKQTGFLRKGWVIFKNGKAELWFILSIYNMIQLWLIRGQDLSILLLVISITVICCFIFGWIDIKKIKTSNPYLNPYTQDNLVSTIALQNGFIQLAMGNNEKAMKHFIEARTLREKWLDK